MKKGILNEIQQNKFLATLNSGVQGQLLQRKQNSSNNQLFQSNQNKQVCIKQNLMVSCDDDDGIDITKFDSNTCIDQENDSKYENYRNEQYQKETIAHGQQGKLQNDNLMNINKKKGKNTINQNSKSKINNVSKEFYESSRNHNTTFSAIGSICDEDDLLESRSVNKQTINEIMKAMPKSAQQILERIMERNTQDESKVTLNPSQSQDYQDDQNQQVNFHQITQQNSQNTYHIGYQQSFQGHINDSQNKNNSRTNLLPQSNINNHINQKENKSHSSYLKLLHGKQNEFIQNQKNNRNQIQKSQQQTGGLNKQCDFGSQGNKERCQIQQRLLNKNNSRMKDIKQINSKIINSKQQNNFQSQNQKPGRMKEFFQNYDLSQNQNLDDFSFELENIQKRSLQKNSTSPLRSKSNQQLNKKEKISNISLQNKSKSKILDQLESSLIGYNSNSTHNIHQSRDEQYISNQAAKYQFDSNQCAKLVQSDQKQGSKKNIKGIDKQNSRNSLVNLSKSLNKNENKTNTNIFYNFQGRTINHDRSPTSTNSCNIPVEITFSLDKNNPNINKHLFNQQHQNILEQLKNKNQQNILNGVQDRMSQSSFFQRLFSPSQMRSESVGNKKNQNNKHHSIERCGSSLSSYNRNNNTRSTNNLKDDLTQRNINIIKSTSKKTKQCSSKIRSQTSDVFFVERSSQNINKNIVAQNQSKSVRKQNSQIQSTNEKIQRSQNINQINSKHLNMKRGRMNDNVQYERSKSSLTVDRQNNFNSSSTFRASPSPSQQSLTHNNSNKLKNGQFKSSTNNLKNFKSLNIDRTNTPSQEKFIMERSKTQTSQENLTNQQRKKKSSSIDNFKSNKKQSKNFNGQSLSQERLKSLLRSGRISSYFSEGRGEKQAQMIKQIEKQAINNKSKGKLKISNQKQNNNYQKEENEVYSNQFKQNNFNANIDNQKNEQNSMNTSLSSQINMIIMLHEQQKQQQQNLNVSQELFSSGKNIQNYELSGNNQFLNQQLSSKINQQNVSNQIQKGDHNKQFYTEGSFFNDNSFGGKEKYSSSSLICNMENRQHQQPSDKFESHISSINSDSYRNYENLEPRCVDSKTVNEIMKSMPSSAQQILQRIMSGGGKDTSQVMIKPTQLQNNSLPLNFSFDIDSVLNGYQKTSYGIKNIVSSVNPSFDPTSIRDDDELAEDHACKQSNSTDIEQIVKQLNFEQNSQSFACSSSEKRCRSNSLSKSFSSSSKKRFGINCLNSNDKYHLKPYDDNLNMLEDDFRLDSRLKSLDKMINLSENGIQKQQVNQLAESNSYTQKNFNKIQQLSSKQNNQQKNLSYSNSNKLTNISFDEINNSKLSNKISEHSEKKQKQNILFSHQNNNSSYKQIYNSGKKTLGLSGIKQFDGIQQQGVEQELFPLTTLTPEQIKLLEELTRQQMIEISKRDLNLSQTSFKSSSSIKTNKQNSSLVKNKNEKQVQQTSQNKNFSNNENLIQNSLTQIIKPPYVINPPVPKEFQNMSKLSNITANNTSICNTSQTNESFASLIQKPIPNSLVLNNSICANNSQVKQSSKGNQKKSIKGLDKLNQSNRSTELGSQIMNQSSLITKNNNLWSGSKLTIEDSQAYEKSNLLQQSTNISINKHPLMSFKQSASVQLNNSNPNGNSNRVKKLNDSLQNLQSQLAMNQINENKQNLDYRALSLDQRKYQQSPNRQNNKSQRNNNFDSPQIFQQYNSNSCSSLSVIPTISQNSILNRSLKGVSSDILSAHKNEIQAQGQDISQRSISSAQRNEQHLFTNSDQQNIQREELQQNQNKTDSQNSSKVDSSKRVYSLNNQDMLSSQFLWGQNEEVGTKRYLENLQLTVSEKEAEIISLKLQVQDLQEVLDKQKFLQSSQKQASKKKYDEIEEKIISSRINIGQQLKNSGSTKSINSFITNPSDIKREYSEQKFGETYPKKLQYINSTLKKQNLMKEYQTPIQNQDNSLKKDKINNTTDMSGNLCDSDRSNLKLNASEIDLTYQINQFTLIKQKEEEQQNERNDSP